MEAASGSATDVNGREKERALAPPQTQLPRREVNHLFLAYSAVVFAMLGLRSGYFIIDELATTCAGRSPRPRLMIA